MNKDYLIGAGTGLLVNRTIQKTTIDYWRKLGDKAAAERVIVYNKAIKEGKTEEEATAIAFKSDPIWRKLGSNRVNGLATAVVGAIVYFGNKQLGSGIVAAGAAKVIFSNEIMDLDFNRK